MLPNLQFLADLVTFTEEILNGKLHFLCSVCFSILLFSSDIPIWHNHDFHIRFYGFWIYILFLVSEYSLNNKNLHHGLMLFL